MINLKKINSIDWTKQNISILGAGISGLGATKLAAYLKANVLLSESKNVEINIPETDNFKYECDGHSDQVLKSDLIIKSPGIPNNIPLNDGDILSVDCGVLKNGFYGDHAYTFEVGEVPQ